jgi:hypothetical protein
VGSGKGEFAARQLIMDYHMKNSAKMAKRFADISAGDGSL